MIGRIRHVIGRQIVKAQDEKSGEAEQGFADQGRRPAFYGIICQMVGLFHEEK